MTNVIYCARLLDPSVRRTTQGHRDFTNHEIQVIEDLCESFANIYRTCYSTYGITEEGDGWCVVYDTPERTGDPACQIFIEDGLIHHVGKFGKASPSTSITEALFETLPATVIEEYKVVALG